MFSNKDMLDMIFPIWLRVIVVVIILVVIGLAIAGLTVIF